MNNGHSFTYIIGYRHFPDRLNNLRRVLDWINCFGGVDVILIEQDTHSKISHLNLKARHIFLKTDKPYNKSWAFNVATNLAKSDIIVFADSDLIMRPEDFIEGLKLLEQFDMVNPYKSVIDLNPQESTVKMEDMVKIDRAGRGETDHQKVPICGGICMFRKDSIMRIGGWNEDFIGWGAEDDFVSHKVQQFLNWKQLDHKCYHLFHGRTQPDAQSYQRNLQLLQHLVNLPKQELIKSIQKNLPKNGMKNKYDTF